MELTLESLTPVVSVLRSARRILVITGAGLSADSGLPTYRGVGGLYEDNPNTEDGMPVEKALSGPMFRQRPELTWRHILQIENACRSAMPNDGHRIVAKWEQRFDKVCVLTQNIDGFHRKAGSTHVIDIHGDTRDLLCTECNWQDTVEDYSGLPELPRCPKCDAVIRPNVVLFEEMLDVAKLADLAEQQSLGFDVIFSIGTSALFPYIAQPVWAAQQTATVTVEINPQATELSSLVTYAIRSKAAAALTALDEALEK
ncbi:MAG: NAD-dependent protein deacylase [Myxococcota bacterium]